MVFDNYWNMNKYNIGDIVWAVGQRHEIKKIRIDKETNVVYYTTKTDDSPVYTLRECEIERVIEHQIQLL